METIKNISSVIGCIVSAITLISLCTKGGRAAIKNLFKQQNKELIESNNQQNKDIQEIKKAVESLVTKMDIIEENQRQQCRNTIKNIYYHYCNTEKIPLFERKTADKTFQIYSEKFHGNSYASLLYNEICKWKIEPSPLEVDDDEST